MRQKGGGMTRVLRCAALIGALTTASACGTEHPTGPSAFPVAIYRYSSPLDYASSFQTIGSRYLLYPDGVFGLQYDAFAHVSMGTYRQDGTTITFRFDDFGIATGTLNGDLLEVRYSEIMQHSDFENAVYRRSE
jgi:hypothetical protein